ncbi:glycosyltransferase [Cohnella sp. REN36]|uniref:glycosyltransferase n=1 Tax=Cohnella sp. REN36 TaxID=2887347 RepID=UPI001D15BF8C|nr:glycosyltransferase [Cohnella sp. REN36]MCC3374068.1 tetratricopeptide repeat protein [Cohnella sp. REN36]
MSKLLSLCMICKNEEKVLTRCLESVQGIADEIIVVDTGSTDKTKEIARRYTEHVYDFVWVNDFAMAKNEAIRRATSKWILVLDADEYLDRDGKDAFLAYLSNQDHRQPVGYVLPIYNFIDPVQSGKFMESSAVRLFPNHPDIYFDRPIHEQVELRGGELPSASYPLVIFHTGYLTETKKEKQKSARNLSIFKDLKSSQSFTEYDYFTLANEYSVIRDYKKALYYYERALTKKTEKMSIFPFVRYQIVLVLIELKRYKDALVYIEDNLRRWPNYPDYYTIKGSVFEALGLYEEAIALYQEALEKADSHGKNGRFWVMSPSLGSHLPITNLVKLYQDAQNIPQTVYHLTQLVQMNTNDHLSLFRLLNILVQSESPEGILAFLKKIFDFEQESHLIKLLHESLLLGHRELSTYFYESCLDKNVAIRTHQELHYALICGERGRFDSNVSAIPESPNKGQINKLLFLAAIVWQDTRYGEYLDESEDAGDPSLQLLRDMIQTLDEVPSDEKELAFDVNYIVTLLIDLFKMGYYEAYDRLIQQYPTYNAILANLLGDYFYNQTQYQLSVDYYSLLLSNEELAGPGYYHLSQLYLHQNEVTDGLALLRKAIELVPSQSPWYIRYLKSSTDSSERNHIIERYRNEFPSYYQIPIIQQMIKGQA